MGRSVAWPIVMQMTNESPESSDTSVRGSALCSFRSRGRFGMRSSHSARESMQVTWQSRGRGNSITGAGDMAGAEDDDPPIAVIVGFEEQLHGTAARHADVTLEIPFDEFSQRRLIGRLGEHRTSVLDGFEFDAPAANSPRVKSARRDEHLTARVLRSTADGLDHRHAHEWHAALRQLGQSFDESVWRGHTEQGARSEEFLYTSILASPATPIFAMPLSYSIRRRHRCNRVLYDATFSQTSQHLFTRCRQAQLRRGTSGPTAAKRIRAAAQTATASINGGSPTALLRYTFRTLSLLSNVAT